MGCFVLYEELDELYSVYRVVVMWVVEVSLMCSYR